MKKLIFLFLLAHVVLATLVSCKEDDESDIDVPNYNTIIPEFSFSNVLEGENIKYLLPTNDGGYIAIEEGEDYQLIKYDKNFNHVWNKTYGGSDKDDAESLIQTKDGGYLVSGRSKSTDGDIEQNYGDYDIWLCKLSSTGDLLWSKNYGGSGTEAIREENSVLETSNGGFYIIGYTSSNDGHISNNKGELDAWLIKINSVGDIEFEKTFGGTESDFGVKINKVNSNYVLLTNIRSSDGDFSEPGMWVVQMDERGNILWKTNLHGLNSGNITTSTTGETTVINTSQTEFLLSKLDGNGNIIKNKTISFPAYSNRQPFAQKILQTPDGGFIIIGDLGLGRQECVLFRTSSTLDVKYEKIISGTSLDKSVSLFPSGNHSYIYQIVTYSDDIDGIQCSEGPCSAIITVNELFE